MAHSLNKYGEGGFGYGGEDGILAYSPLTSDTIFRIKDGQFTPAYYVDFGKNKFPDGLSPELRYDLTSRKTVYTGIIDEVVTNDSVLYFTYSRNRVIQDAYYFINSGRLYTGARHSKSKVFIPVGHTLNYADGYFIACADAYDMTVHVPEIAQDIQLKEDDNPVLILYRFKQNI